MINFKFLFGLIPNTEKIEAKENALIKEYLELESYKKSDELKYFLEIKEFVASPEFAQKKESVKALEYKKTEEFSKEKEYLALKKSSRIKNYYKVLSLPLYKNYLEVKDSDELRDYLKLKALVESATFKQKEREIKSLKYNNTEEYKKEQEYIRLGKSDEIKNYFKVLSSSAYGLYKSLSDSDELKNYMELKKYSESSEILSLEKSVKNAKFDSSPEYAKLKRLKELKNSDGIKNYLKLLKNSAFENYKHVHDSEEIAHFYEIEKFVKSEKFAQLKADKEKFEGSKEQEKEIYYNNLLKDKHIVTYFSFLKSKQCLAYQEAEKSGIIKEYVELSEFIKSKQFTDVEAYYKISPEKRWQQKAEYAKVGQYKNLKKEKKFIDYFKFVQSKEFKLFTETINSGIAEKYNKLKELVNTAEFKDKKAYMLLSPAKKWEQTEEFRNGGEYKKLSKERRITDYIKFTSSALFKLFEEVVKSGEIQHFEELEKLVNSEEFKNNKAYMLLPFKEKWKQTEEYKKDTDYKKLKVSEKIKWYYKVVDSDKFDEIKKWEVTFSEDFASDNLNKDLWLTRFYWGDALLHDTYSMSNDQHFTTDGNNLSVQNSILKIETRREKATGKAWDPMFGFKPKEFEFTSGLINTGKSFRQQYGRFRAKIKLNDNGAVTHSFWLVGKQIMPHIDIFKYSRKKVAFNNFWGNVTEKNGIKISSSKMSGSKLNSKFYIYELEWTPKELIWKINGLVLKKETNGVPDEPMYLSISSGIFELINGHQFPSSMEIDWVKCYKDLSLENKYRQEL